eukprot:Phypoly_transcript_01557.p1 GENE.Phypoly_transcript_01557~~Phypoly_transcript_01557.p1  ORF type:complete len:961 (-),score=214.93 Phypoly_transcript_01557:327-3209(-)
MASSPPTPAPKFQANLNFNKIMAKMEQNVKSAFKPKKAAQHAPNNTKMRTYFGDEELLNSIPEEYYREGYDVLSNTLSKLPADFDEAYLDKVIEEKEAVLEVLNGRLFTRVMSSYGAFVQGMTQIGELSGDLQQSTIMCKNGRRNLQSVREQLTRGGVVVLAILRRRQNVAFIVEDLQQIRSLLVFQQVLQKLLHVGDYPKTIETCLEARKTVARCSKYHVVRELDLELQSVYNNVASRLDKALFDICRNFTPDNYEGLISAYKLLGSTSRIAEKLQSNFVDPIEADTKSIVVAHVLQSAENIRFVESIKKRSFKEACAEVKEEHFMNCLLTILEFMCDLMFSHYQMSRWHAERQAKEENRGYAEINAAMDRFKKTMWDAMQKQGTILITSTNLMLYKVEDFVKVVDAVSTFLDIGEEFSSTVAINFRNLLKSQGKLYLETFHRQRADDLKTMLENEMWTRCPVSASFSVDDVKEFTESLGRPLRSTTPPPAQLQTKITKSFDKIFASGNPFTNLMQSQRRKAPAHATAAALAAQKKTDENDDSDDDEPAELRADYIDDDGHAVARNQPQRTTQTEDKGPLLAPTTLTVVRLLAKYIHLLRVLYASLGLEVFVAVVQLVEYFIYTVYTFFGTPPPGTGLSQDDLVASMSPALRKMILRIKDRISAATPVLLSAVHTTDGQNTKEKANINNSPHDLIRIKWTLVRPTPAQVAELASAKAGIGMGMRTVGVESLLFLADALLKARNVLQSMMPPNASEFFTSFYKNVNLIPELRTHMYKGAASALFVTESIGRAVESVKWETSQVMNEHNEYVDRILKELAAFKVRLDKIVTLPPKVKMGVWEGAIMRGMDVLVESYAKIKKCSMEGRANMLLDINALQRGIESIAPLRDISTVPGISHALNFANAYYLPLDDIPEWAQQHPEFPLRQVLALVAVNPASATNRAKRQQVVAALEELDKSRRK